MNYDSLGCGPSYVKKAGPMGKSPKNNLVGVYF